MGLFTDRERAELGRSMEIGVEGKGGESVRHDFAPRQRPREDDAAGHLGSLMQRVAKTALQEIDDLIAELRRRRERLLSETARVQCEIIEYAKLNQSAVQSTKTITERLSNLKQFLDARAISEVRDEGISNENGRESEAEAFTQQSDRTFGDQAEPTAALHSRYRQMLG
jgi:hypothetical protein